jgi:hypothetical protein
VDRPIFGSNTEREALPVRSSMTAGFGRQCHQYDERAFATAEGDAR